VPAPKKKVTLYFSAGMLEETQREAIRQDRSISWIIQAAWRMSRDEVRKLPNAAGAAPSGTPAPTPAATSAPIVSATAAPRPKGRV
jgi:uncharacterized small protein (TIGR04563 family)